MPKTEEELKAEAEAKAAAEKEEADKKAKEEADKKAAEEAAVGEGDDDDDDDDNDDDPYTKELKKMEAANAKLSDENRQKAGALKEEKEKRGRLEQRLAALEEKISKSGGTIDENTLAEKIRAEIQAESVVEKMTDNPKERELIKTIMKEKNLSAEDAQVLANRHIVQQYKEQELSTDGEEIVLARLSGGGPAGGAKKPKSPILKAAAIGLTPAEQKHLKIDEDDE